LRDSQPISHHPKSVTQLKQPQHTQPSSSRFDAKHSAGAKHNAENQGLPHRLSSPLPNASYHDSNDELRIDTHQTIKQAIASNVVLNARSTNQTHFSSNDVPSASSAIQPPPSPVEYARASAKSNFPTQAQGDPKAAIAQTYPVQQQRNENAPSITSSETSSDSRMPTNPHANSPQIDPIDPTQVTVAQLLAQGHPIPLLPTSNKNLLTLSPLGTPAPLSVDQASEHPQSTHWESSTPMPNWEQQESMLPASDREIFDLVQSIHAAAQIQDSFPHPTQTSRHPVPDNYRTSGQYPILPSSDGRSLNSNVNSAVDSNVAAEPDFTDGEIINLVQSIHSAVQPNQASSSATLDNQTLDNQIFTSKPSSNSDKTQPLPPFARFIQPHLPSALSTSVAQQATTAYPQTSHPSEFNPAVEPSNLEKHTDSSEPNQQESIEQNIAQTLDTQSPVLKPSPLQRSPQTPNPTRLNNLLQAHTEDVPQNHFVAPSHSSDAMPNHADVPISASTSLPSSSTESHAPLPIVRIPAIQRQATSHAMRQQWTESYTAISSSPEHPIQRSPTNPLTNDFGATEANASQIERQAPNELQKRENQALDVLTTMTEQEEEKEAAADDTYLELLAREIYAHVRQKLLIERERRQGSYYQGRLPW
jgi:hypothetical protein